MDSQDVINEIEAFDVKREKMITGVFEHLGQRYVSAKDFIRLEAQTHHMRDALRWSEDFFLARDRMNAKVHCAPLRLSPITERILLALGKELPNQ